MTILLPYYTISTTNMIVSNDYIYSLHSLLPADSSLRLVIWDTVVPSTPKPPPLRSSNSKTFPPKPKLALTSVNVSLSSTAPRRPSTVPRPVLSGAKLLVPMVLVERFVLNSRLPFPLNLSVLPSVSCSTPPASKMSCAVMLAYTREL